MFNDPDGNRIELSAEIGNDFDELATYPPRTWGTEQRTADLWGPAPAWRVPRQATASPSDVARIG